jgi:vacuolar protein sorting-associated protein 26
VEGSPFRYYIKAIIHRKLSDESKEVTLWCPGQADLSNELSLTSPIPIEMDVGLEDFLHIKMRLHRAKFTFLDEIIGTLYFLLVRVRVIDVEVSLVRKEIFGDDVLVDTTILLTKQALHGPANRGDTVPVGLDLASVAGKLSPTMINVNKTFSIRHYIGVILKDAEGRKYYKQVEIILEKPGRPALYDILPDFRMGLVAA